MNALATWIDRAFSEIAAWLPTNTTAAAILVCIALIAALLAWLLIPGRIARRVVPQRAGRPRRKLETQVADRWRGIIGRALTVPTLVLTALYSLYQVGQASQEAAEATILETHKNAFDALASKEEGPHFAGALALGQLLKANGELRTPILSALSTHTVAWSPRRRDQGQTPIRGDARMALEVIAFRPSETAIDCLQNQEGETTLWFVRGNFRGMPFPVLRDENEDRRPVQLDRADFYESDLSGSDLFCASLGYANLNGSNLDGANLIEANLCGAKLIDASLLSGENLASPKLQGSPHPVYAYRANFRKAILHEAKLDGAMLDEAVLDCAEFDGASAVETSFYCARGDWARFSQAILTGSDFKNAFLRNADFRGASLSEVEWSNAYLEGAVFDDTPTLLDDLRDAYLCKTYVGRNSLDRDCGTPWSGPPATCFDDPSEETCSPHSLFRSEQGELRSASEGIHPLPETNTPGALLGDRPC